MIYLCNTCNKPFYKWRHKTSKRVFCSRECFFKSPIPDENLERRNSHTSRHYAHDIAHKTFKKKCMICKSNKNLETHHKDGNFRNNKLQNLMLICSSCHHKIDNRILNIPKSKYGSGYGYKKLKEVYELNRQSNGRWDKWS
jgi:hypothetical protein